MPFVTGFLRLRRGGHPDQGLPGGEGAVDPDYGVDEGGGGFPDNSLPTPPPGVWPPLTPSHPIQPAPPGTPPGSIWPPVFPPARPDQGLPSPQPPQPGHPDQGLPGGGRPVDPGYGHPGTFWIVAGIPGVGWRYVCVDPSLSVGYPLPPTPEPK